MGYTRKNQTGRGGVEDMEFPDVPRKIMSNFQWLLFLTSEFPRNVTQFDEISRGGALFCQEFPKVK